MSCCLSSAGMGAVVAGRTNSTFLTSMCQLAHFGFTSGLEDGGMGLLMALQHHVPTGLSVLGPHFTSHPQAPAPMPQFPHQKIRDNDGGIKSGWITVLFWLLTVFTGLTWDGGGGGGQGISRKVLVVEQSPFHWIPVWGQYWVPQHTNPLDLGLGILVGALTHQSAKIQSRDHTGCLETPACLHLSGDALPHCQHETSCISTPPWPPLLHDPMAWTGPFPAPSPKLQPEEGLIWQVTH